MATPNMGMVLPTEGGDADVWDTLINAALTLNDAHDHTTGKGVRIPSAALKINADTPWNDAGVYYAITGAKAIDFQPSAAAGMAGYAGALFVSSADNELYYRTTAGANVKLTNGAALNVAAFAGGIGGDYSSIGALLDYDDATDTYRFRQQVSAAVRQYAKLGSADLKLFEYLAAGGAVVPVNAVTLKSPAALAAAYALTLPAALPGATAALQCTAAGVLSASNTFANDITMSGTADVKHGDRSIWHSPIAQYASISYSASLTGDVLKYTVPANGVVAIPLLGLKKGDRVKTVSFYGTAGAGNDPTSDVIDQVKGAAVTPAQTGSGSLNVLGKQTRTLTAPITILTDGEMLHLKVTGAAGGATTLYQVEIVFDRP